MDATKLTDQLRKQRRKVDFDTFDITVQQLLSMLQSKAIDIAPAYQRQFRWDHVRCSQLIESIFLGIPVPSLFMAANRDSSWELVDGVQRVSTLVMFAGDDDLRAQLKMESPLRLEGLEKLTEFNGLTWDDLPEAVKLQFQLRPIKVVTLSDKSDRVVRFDLFERLNKGGVELSDQEIRDCVFRGKFSQFLEKSANNRHFRTVLQLTPKQRRDGTREECVLRFFAYFYQYQEFVHSVRGFLNDFMKNATKSFDYRASRDLFKTTFLQLAEVFPNGLARPTAGRTLTTTSLILFEGVAVGAAKAIQETGRIDGSKVNEWLDSEELERHTTGPTNTLAAVKGRIEFCRDRFLGK